MLALHQQPGQNCCCCFYWGQAYMKPFCVRQRASTAALAAVVHVTVTVKLLMVVVKVLMLVAANIIATAGIAKWHPKAAARISGISETQLQQQ